MTEAVKYMLAVLFTASIYGFVLGLIAWALGAPDWVFTVTLLCGLGFFVFGTGTALTWREKPR